MFPILLCYFMAFLVAFAGTPTIIRLATKFSFFDEPNERKMHGRRIPLLGGIAIFGAMLFAFTIWSGQYFTPKDLYIIAALIIIFFFGLRDDLAPLAPLKKLSGQVIASLIIVLFCNMGIKDLHGLLGIHEVGVVPSILLSLLVMLTIINAFNLIDGIDGLATGLGIIASALFGLVFLAYGELLMSVLAFALCGALSGFLPYNFYKASIFMGDTGTMTIGFILSVFTVHFTELSTAEAGGLFSYHAIPSFQLSVLIVPVADMIRVFMIRIFRGRSPFSPDRNHIHHRLLQLGLNPAQACLVLYAVSIGFAGLSWLLRDSNDPLIFWYLFAGALLLSQLPLVLMKRSRQVA